MLHTFRSAVSQGRSIRLIAVTLAMTLAGSATLWAQNQGNNNTVNAFVVRPVGGVSIDASGVVTSPDKAARLQMRDVLRKSIAAPASELNQAAELRMVSLRRLEEAIAAAEGKLIEQLPDDVRFLAGLQRIQYVLVYPEERDIVLAGPGEGWIVNDQGAVVGVTTGRPVLLLEDLVVALRTVENARQGGISCSIDPTPEGRQRLDALIASRAGSGAPPLVRMKQALGAQQITLTGVPADSHFARVLVSSDFHMKRLGMNLEPSQVRGFPSYLEMLKQAANETPTPRWWLACNYEPVGRSDDGLAFELRGQGVKCLAEDEVVDARGNIAGTGTVSPTAQKWADLMTAHYDDLATKEAAFGELRNVMDICVVAALIAKEQLLAKADCQLPLLTSPSSPLRWSKLPVPRSVDSICSSVKRGSAVIVMTGGVQIGSWQVADRMEVRPDVAKTRERAKPAGGVAAAWWNAAR